MSTLSQPVGDHTVADNNRASGCQHQGNRRSFRLTGRTRGAPAYCSQVSAFGYYSAPYHLGESTRKAVTLGGDW